MKQGKKSRLLVVVFSVLCILEHRFTHWIKINCIFKVYEEPEEIAPEEEVPVPVVEEEEPKAPPPAGTRQDPLYGKMHHLIFMSLYIFFKVKCQSCISLLESWLHWQEQTSFAHETLVLQNFTMCITKKKMWF